MRPRGDITAALVSAAAHGPGPVRELAARAQVGYAAAAYTVCRMVSRGELVVLSRSRPLVVAVPGLPAAAGQAPRSDDGHELHNFFFVGQASGAALAR